MSYVYLAVAIIAEVIGTTAMKQSDGFTRLVPSLVTAAGYAAAPMRSGRASASCSSR